MDLERNTRWYWLFSGTTFIRQAFYMLLIVTFWVHMNENQVTLHAGFFYLILLYGAQYTGILLVKRNLKLMIKERKHDGYVPIKIVAATRDHMFDSSTVKTNHLFASMLGLLSGLFFVIMGLSSKGAIKGKYYFDVLTSSCSNIIFIRTHNFWSLARILILHRISLHLKFSILTN